MYINVSVKDINYNVHVYEYINNFDKTIFMLHGWGMDGSTFDNINTILKTRYNVISIDLIGFGKSDTMRNAFNLNDYAYMLHNILNYYIERYKFENICFLGHSFGGRIIIKYLSCYKNNNLKGIILCSSAGIKNRSFKKYYKIYKYKFKKAYFRLVSIFSKSFKIKLEKLINTSGSSDYIGLNNELKGTMSLALREDLFYKLANIKVKTIITWGKNDLITPLNEGILFKNKIKNSKLILFENSGHFPYISEEKKFIGVCDYALSDYFCD